jgi:hypothetical protein
MRQLASEAFDAVLLMGPMYHITDAGDRHKVLESVVRKRGRSSAPAAVLGNGMSI